MVGEGSKFKTRSVVEGVFTPSLPPSLGAHSLTPSLGVLVLSLSCRAARLAPASVARASRCV